MIIMNKIIVDIAAVLYDHGFSISIYQSGRKEWEITLNYPDIHGNERELEVNVAGSDPNVCFLEALLKTQRDLIEKGKGDE